MGAETELILPTSTVVARPSVKAAPGGHPNDASFDINSSEFPAGLRVLVVDDDPICLLILDRMLQSCRYKVTTCGGAVEALRILRENKDRFDLVISDVQMPDMDGFKLLELVGLEMDLPVIMMSSNGATSAVMKGIKHGACDYLLKPVRIEELRNIWQHVVRKKKRDSGSSDNFDDKRHSDAGEYLLNDGVDGSSKLLKKRKEDDDDLELENEDPSTAKKPRVVWSVELHQKFVNAVNQLGIDKAVPKRILELMDVRGLTRENVASHLQKYRLYLKRISEVPQPHQTGGLGATILGSPDSSFRISGAGFNDYVSKSSIQTSSLDRSSSSGLAGREMYALRQLAAIHGVNSGAVAPRASHSLQPSSNISAAFVPTLSTGMHNNQGLKHSGSFGQSDNSLPSVGDTHQLSSLCNMGGIGPVVSGLDNCVSVDNANDTLLAQILQQQCNGNMMSCLGGIGNIGLPMASVDSGVKHNPKISTNDGRSIGAYYDGRAGLTKLTFPASSGNNHNGIKSAEFRSLNVPYNISPNLSTTLCTNLDASVKVSDASDICGSKNTASILQPGSRSVSNYMGPDNLHSWPNSLMQNQISDQKSHLALNQDFGQSYKMGSLSDQGSGQMSVFQESDLYGSKSSLAALMGDQSIREGEMMFKEATFPTKTITGVAHEAFPLLDDTLMMYAKQTHAGQSESDFSIGKYALGNMHVK